MAVALNCGTGSSSLNAEVNALERLQMVRGLNSSYFGFKVEVVHAAGTMLGNFQSALDESLVDDHLCCDVRQFTPLPGFHLLSHGLEVSLHSVDADRDAVDERERLRVLREHRSEYAWDNVAKLKLTTALTP